MVLPLARNFSDAKVVGYELSPLPYLYSRIRAAFSHVEIRRRDFFHESLWDARVVVCYLSPGIMERLRDKFEKELQPGTIVISNTFAVPKWVPHRVYQISGTPVYVYQV